ncbi:MAG: DMT family transporter [Holophaga sp.]|nr:DMT family transporter [Holophaga sp.]
MAPARQDHTLMAWLALAFGTVCIGFSAIFVKLAHVPGPASAFYRVLIASLVLVPCWLVRRRRRLEPADLRLIVAGGIFFAVDIAMWNTSILLTSAATATLLANNAPLWVGLASFLLFKERLSGRYWLGLAVALAGMMWLVGGAAFRQLRLDGGNLLAVGASLFYAAYLLTAHRARARADLLTVVTLSTVVSVAALLVINLAMGTALSGYGRSAWLALAGLGLISQLGGWLGINYALGHLRAAPVSVFLLAQVVVTAAVAMPVLGEFVKTNQVVGGVLVLAGIVLVILGTAQEALPS